MNKSELKRVIDMMTQAKGETDKIIVDPFSTCIAFSIVSNFFVSHFLISGEKMDKRRTIYLDQLEFMKAHYKSMASSDDISIEEIIDKFGSSDKHLNTKESDTYAVSRSADANYEFQIHWKTMDKAYKAIANGDPIIKIKIDEKNKKMVILNSCSDSSLLSLVTPD